ncbi:hypothetical protein D0T12_15485 [Actinomadura spongiicola]|uniref:Uncharacterized protein n=1 Tax=Actinomadura spongiicola TaxID=2303421 RepID=A0A372GHR6_9ACTN|nr:hypothetical protein [Actinomadura spongiicola]RFS84908.1 hypothetical protein D0T12_15485 [Actinomadura spongiicola]
MSAQVITEGEEALGHLERLTVELRDRGWTVEVAAPHDRRPSAIVADPRTPNLNDGVIAAQEGPDGSWAYFYAWGERIASCADPSAAATALGRVRDARRDG